MLLIQKNLILLSLLYLSTVLAFPSDTSSLVVSTTEPTKETTNENETAKVDDVPVLPKIYDMKINTNVSNRFAKTLITSKVKNLAKTAQEATFSVVLPEQAYISGFIMEIDGKSYEAYIQEKEEAKKTYDQAVLSGTAAGHVAVSARDSNRFTVSVNIEPQSKAVFYLTYEELLQRRNDQYEVVINIHPGQPVKNLNVEVLVNETRPLKFVKAPSLRSGNEISKNDEKLDPHAQIDIVNKTAATVTFNPDVERQKQLASGLGTKEENGLAGQFIVQYDVERDPQGGEVLVNDGYFVHFFAPSELKSLPKHVIFVLDTSGSMDGIRITQLKEAMNSILGELTKDDILNIVEFGSIVKVWNVEDVKVQYQFGEDPWTQNNEKNNTEQVLPPPSPATEENVKKAKEVVSKLAAFGGTDIQSALKVALELVNLNVQHNLTRQPIIVFLTDGEPTVGEYSTAKITSTITELNTKKTPIFSLSFGDGADRDFLQKISLKNQGFARHIYEGADASMQLSEFYKQISSPLLANVTFKYVSKVANVTRTKFPILFYGSEIVVSGIIDPGFAPPAVEGWGIHGPIELQPTVEQPVGSLERIWAYLTLKQLLEQRDAADDKTGPTQEALRIALKYKFVSDVSSLVVVKPNATKSAVDTEDASKNTPLFNYASVNKIGHFGLGFGGAASGSFAPAAYSPAYAAAIPLHGAILPAQQFAEVDSDFDSMSFPSTPLVLPSTTTVVSPSTTTAVSPTTSNPLNQLKSALPWLSSILNENGTLTLSSGSYKLGVDETVPNKPECPKTPTNSTGVCVLLHQCPQVYSLLTEKQVFEDHFCALNEYAGICCPTAVP